MDFFETINTRKTIRKYKPDMPDMDDVRKIIDAARVAPSATNSQNWQFIVIKNKNILEKMKNAVINEYDKLAELNTEEEFLEKINYFKSYSTFFVNAPIVIAIVETKRVSYITEMMKKLNFDNEKLKYMRPDSSLLSIGGAIENMSLAAHNLGYGTCWMVAPIIATEEFSKLLNLDNDSHVVSLLPLGIPYRDDYQSPPKKTLEEVIKIID
ncbi:nitroreductase family protein [bacterium]|nr:nitroreductase family protein [bacterium]